MRARICEGLGMQRIQSVLILAAVMMGGLPIGFAFELPKSAQFAKAKNAAKSKNVKVKTKKTKRRKNQTKPKKKRPKRSASKKAVTIPIDIGIGPAVHQFTGPVQRGQQYHTGLKLSLAAIIDRDVIESQKHRVPKKYRGMVKKLDTVRLRPGPLILVPETIFISPPKSDTGIYGANWRFLGLSIPLAKILDLGTGVNLTYAYLTGSDANPKTHFLRPGLDFTANMEVPFSKSFLMSLGWSSFVYPPQPVGAGIGTWGNLDESIWHIGQAYLRLHFRIPYEVNL